MKNLKDKVFVITGCASGIGKNIALQLADKGAKLAISDINSEALENTIELLKQKNANLIYEVFDVADKQSWQHWHDKVLNEFGVVNCLINNAGVALSKIPLTEVKDEDFEWVMNINLWGVIYGSQTFLPTLLKSSESSLVNISSAFGLAGIADQVPYCTTKFAVRGFTESLRMELQQTHPNICIQCVHPGGIGTNIVRNGRSNSKQEHEQTIKDFDDKLVKTTVENCATTIIKGIQNKRQKILVGYDVKLLDRVVRHFPVTYTKLLNLTKRLSGL